MQIESDGDDEMPHRPDGEKDRAKDNNQVKFFFITTVRIVCFSVNYFESNFYKKRKF